MKKKLAIGLSLILLISCTAVTFSFAETQHTAGIFGKNMESGYDLKMLNESGAQIGIDTGTLKDGGDDAKAMSFFDAVEKMDLSFKGEAKTQYMVFLLKPGEGGVESAVPTSSNILYIDQIESGEDGKTKFTVYPSQLSAAGTYAIYVSSSERGYQKVGNFVVGDWVESSFVLGDCNTDTKVDSIDSLAILKHYAEIKTLAGDQLTAGDVNGDGNVDSMDSLAVLKFYAEMIDSFYPKNLY